ncbi:pantoate--beta-alanine ligase [Methylotenera mobilis]|uniref:Pantothenate synthetase n=1 Tax=Methylotenera mobilis (strain JLW8 / ATCC BAA-1282 / DSM 17540) TaxID=583345 RepID=C6WXZ1_METML|nr:pantoate--beta-alanine ligase [Methylotenera mobilis]ACT48790.1 pantoate/beta-alanine ligase [Methylotenera mobilis JLW8]
MQRIYTADQLRNTLKAQHSIAFVPTMGNLHDGHIALVSLAKQHAKCVVASIFVNPLQFGPNEDFASYPRTLEADCKRLEEAGADIVFIPSVTEMYPDFDGQQLNQSMTISAPPIATELCGASRPGHFSGVATVVMKLFNLVMPQVAVFGKKDFQQVFVIKELVRQFNLPIQIIAGDTVRETSGLAMSSRNGYLTPAQKAEAAQLHQCLVSIVNQIQQGNINFAGLTQSAAQTLTQKGWLVDYISVRAADTLLPATNQDKQLVVLIAAKLGNTRLIDNIDFCAK